jgi:hypothetical protein
LEVLGHDPWQRQVEILESVRDNKVTVVKSCHAAGKSFVAADACLWYLFNHPGSIVISTAPTDRQVTSILWREIRSAHSKAGLPGQCLQQELKIAEDWFAMGFTAPEHSSEKFLGWHATHILVVVDESSGVSDDIFDAVDSLLTSNESRLLLIGNPTSSSGRFYREFSTASRANKISIDAFSTPNFVKFGITEQDIISGEWEAKITGSLPAPYLVTPGWVTDRLKQWGRESLLYRSKVLANFPAAGNNNLIPLAWIEAAVNRDLPAGAPVQLGVDVARFGKDETVLVLREGSKARILKVLPMSDTMSTSGEIIAAMRETGATLAKIDSVGLGAGVYDRLKEQNIPVIEMQSGAAAQDRERYGNCRASWWFELRERFETGDISIPDDEELVSQLASINYRLDSKGRIFIESKSDMKSSPDRGDALMFAFAGENTGAAFAAFSTDRLLRCISSSAGYSRGEDSVGVFVMDARKTALSFVVGHIRGSRVVITVAEYFSVVERGFDWGAISQKVKLLCLQYQPDAILCPEGLIDQIRRGISDNSMALEIPATSLFREKAWSALEDRIHAGTIEIPDNDRLLQEFGALRKEWTGERASFHAPTSGLITSCAGVEAVSILCLHLGDQCRQWGIDTYEPGSSREWPSDFTDSNPGYGGWPAMIAPGHDHMED